MRRRQTLSLGFAALASMAVQAGAQEPTPKKAPRVGILSPAESDQAAIFEALRNGLREHGYVDGRNIVLEFRLARGEYGALPRLADELVNAHVDVIVTDGALASRIAKEATQTIPVVMGTSSAATGELGIAPNLARPGGNVTGFTMQGELSAKRLDLLLEAFPNSSNVTVLLNPANAGSDAFFRVVQRAANTRGVQIRRVEAGSSEALRGLRPAVLGDATPLLVLPDALFWNHRAVIISLAAAARAPGLYPEREYADDGGLMAYGPNV